MTSEPQTISTGSTRGYDPATSKELPGKRAADTKVFQNADGTLSARVYSKPIHYLTAEREWRDFDNTLVRGRDGRSHNAAGPIRIEVAASADDPDLVALDMGGRRLAYGLSGASRATARVEGDTAVYVDAVPGVDVRVSARDASVKELLVLKSRQTPRRFVFPLRLSGLTASVNGAGTEVLFSDGEGRPQLRVPPGWMEDSNRGVASDEGAQSGGVRYAVVDSPGGPALEVTLDAAWLDDPARVYPVEVDPTAAYIGDQDDTYVATNQTFNGAVDSVLKVGVYDSPTSCAGSSNPGCGGSHFHQSYMHFAGADALDGMTIQSATLRMFSSWSFSCAPRGLGIYRVTQAWGPMTNYPGATVDQGVKGWAAFAKGYSASCPAGWVGIDVTEFVRGWASDAYPNFGLSARVDPGSENDNYTWKKFTSYDGGTNREYLDVVYSPYNASYSCPSPCQFTTNVSPQSSGSIPITVTNKGKDAWPAGGAYRLAYHVLSADGSTTIQYDGTRTFMPVDVAPGQSVALTAAVAPLNAGSYRLRWDMVHEGVAWFSSQGVPVLDMAIAVYNPPPTIKAVAPLPAASVPGLLPTLAVSATNNNAGSLTYTFKLCSDQGMTIGCVNSGALSTPAWTLPTANTLVWRKTYFWSVSVQDGANLSSVTAPTALTTAPTQPTTSQHLGADPYGSGLGGVSPSVGNFSTSITDVAPGSAGPALALVRTYNSQDPRILPFGTGWSTGFDMRAHEDADGSVVITHADGRQVRFGKNPDGSFAPAPAYWSTLTGTFAGGLTFVDKGGTTYAFSAGLGKLVQVTDPDGRSQVIGYDGAGSLASATAANGRKLTFTWTGGHITSVTTDPIEANGNQPYTWTYQYSGNHLTKVCNPNPGPDNCTAYGYQSVNGSAMTSPHAKAVLNNGPDGYWRLGETSGTTATDASGNNRNGAYATGVSLNQPGLVPNDPNRSVQFGGASGHVTLPSGFADFTQGLTLEAWVHPTSNSFWSRVVELGNGAGSDNILLTRDAGSTSLRFSVWKNGAEQWVVAPDALVLNTWQHLAATLTANGTATIYRNGQAVATGMVQVPANVNRTANYIAKSNWSADSLWAGRIDDVAVYSGALTPEAVAHHHRQGQGPVRPVNASLLSTITMPRGNVTATVQYASDQSVASRKDGVQKQWSFASAVAPGTGVKTTTVTDPLARTTKWVYDLQGRLTERVNEEGGSRRFIYDRASGSLTRMVDENGHVVALTYDGQGNVLSRTTARSSTYADAVVASGPVAYWRLGEGWGTTAKDASGSGRDGAYAGGHTLAQPGGLTDPDTAPTFDGATGHMAAPAGFASFPQGLTIEAWVYPTATSNWGRIVDFGNGASADNIFLGRSGTSSSLRFEVFRGATSQGLSAENALVLDTWQHIAVTQTAAGATAIYRNGQQVATGTVHTPNNVNRTSNFIGKSNWAADTPWAGRIDEVAVHPTALSSSAVASRSSAATAPWGDSTTYEYFSGYAAEVLADSPAAYWRLGDRSGSNLYDASQQGRTATAGSAVTKGVPGGLELDGDAAVSMPGTADGSTSATVPMPTTGVTLEAWINLPDSSESGMVVQVGAGGDGYGFGIGGTSADNSSPGNKLHGLYEHVRWIDSGVNVGIGWHHVAMTISSSGSATFFIDGAQVAQSTGAAPRTPSGTVAIGGYSISGHDRWFTGAVDELAVYGGVLPASRLAAHFAKGRNPSGAEPRLNRMTAVRDARSSWAFDNTYRTEYGYDSVGRLTFKTTPPTAGFPAGTTTTWAYTDGTEAGFGGVGTQPRGLLKSATLPGNRTTVHAYDDKGDLRRTVDPVGLTTSYGYDALGRVTSSTESSDAFPGGLTTSWAYGPLSQVLTETKPGAANVVDGVVHTARTTYEYDSNGNMVTTSVADLTGGDATRVTRLAYDDNDRVVSATDPVGGVTAVTYDDVGNVATTVDPRNVTTRSVYTPRSQLASTTVLGFVDNPVDPGTPRDLVVESFAYDPAGRLASSTDAMGTTTAYTYFDNDLPARTTVRAYRNPDGTTRDIVLSSREYDAAGIVIREVADGGRITRTTAYDAAGQLVTSALDPAGLNRVTSLVYDANGAVVARTLAGGGRAETTQWSYDAAGRLVTETVDNDPAADLVTSLTRDQRGVVTGVTNPRGHTTSLVADEARRTVRVVLPAVTVEAPGSAPLSQNPTQLTGYNAFGEVTATRDPRGNVLSASVDALGRTVGITYPTYTTPGGLAITPSESWTYDGNSNVVSSTDRRGQTTTYDYDKLDRVVREVQPKLATQPAAGVRRFAYDDSGNLTSRTDELGAVVRRTYDDLDRVRTETTVERVPSPANLVTTFDYDDSGNMTSLTTPTGRRTTAAYNPAGEATTVTGADQTVTTYGYDVGGRMTSVRDPLGRLAVGTFDLAGRLTSVRRDSPAGATLQTTRFGYDANGNQTSSTTPAGWVTTRAFDALDQLSTVTEPVSGTKSITTSFGYDAAGNRTRLTNGRGHAMTTSYQPWDLPESVAEAGVVWTTTYDAGGLATRVASPGDVVRTRSYDELGRLTQESGAGAEAATRTRTIGYNLLRATSVSHPSGSESLAYNDRGLLTAATGPAGNATFSHDGDGRVVSRTDAAGTSTFTYDSVGNLRTAVDPATGVTKTHTYNANRELVRTDYGTGRGRRDMVVDNLGRLSSDTLKSAAGTALFSVAYDYDANSNVTKKTVGPTGAAGEGTNNYTYDRSGRLLTWRNPASVTTAYSWDDAGNRTQAGATSYAYDDGNRLTSESQGGVMTATYSYTTRGTLSAKTGAGATTLAFDAFDRLVSDGSTSYTYDGLDRLATAGAAVMNYAGLEKEVVGDGSATYARGPGGELLGTASGGLGLELFADMRGDVVGAFAPGGVGMHVTRAYDPWGTVTANAGAASSAPATGYQGSWTDPTTGRVSMQTRFYTPGMAMFASRDWYEPHATTGAGANRYAYAGANPLVNSDPTGEFFRPAPVPTWTDPARTSRDAMRLIGDGAGAAVRKGKTGVRFVGGRALGVVGIVLTELFLNAEPLGYAECEMQAPGACLREQALEEAQRAERLLQEGLAAAARGGDPYGAVDLAGLQAWFAANPIPNARRGSRTQGCGAPCGRGLKRIIARSRATTPRPPDVMHPPFQRDQRILSTAVTPQILESVVAGSAVDAPEVSVASAEDLGAGSASGGLAVGGGAGAPCSIHPGGAMQSCTPATPDGEGPSPEAEPQLATEGAGARQGGGRSPSGAGRRRASGVDSPRSNVGSGIRTHAYPVTGREAPGAPRATLSGRTVLGERWDDAIRAGRRARPETGFHDVVAHGNPTGIYDAAGNLLSPAEAAAVIRATPSWGGQNIRLLSCSTGCPTGSFAQGLANELGVAVRAPTVDFYVNSRGVPVLDPGGRWITYRPGGG